VSDGDDMTELGGEDDLDELDANVDENYDDADDDAELDDEVGGEGNRIVGARARAVVEHVARSLADEPGEIDVDVRERRGEATLLVHAAPGDIGRLIGRRGRVIQAIRQVARAAGASEGIRVSVDIEE
jgi:predicted RNA-binding protein YlqC (UPF0109 family)